MILKMLKYLSVKNQFIKKYNLKLFFKSFLSNKKLPEAEKAIRQGIEKIRLRSKAGKIFESELNEFDAQ